MKPHELAELLSDLDNCFLTEVVASPGRRPRRLAVGLAAVLCLVALIGGTTAYAAGEHGGWILDIFGRRPAAGDPDSLTDESGYSLDFTIDRIDPALLSDELLATGDEIVQAIRDYQLHMSHIPNIQYRRYDTAAEACAFVGYAPLFMPELGLAGKGTTVSIFGDEGGNIRNVGLEENLSTDTIVVQSFAKIYTTHHTGSVGTGAVTRDWADYAPTEQLTPTGRRCLIVRSSSMDNDPTERRSIDAYLIRDSVFYHLHIAHDPVYTEESIAEGILARWIEAVD